MIYDIKARAMLPEFNLQIQLHNYLQYNYIFYLDLSDFDAKGYNL